MNQGWPDAAPSVFLACIVVAHYKIRLIKKWPSRTELLAITDECVGVALCVYLGGWRGARRTTYRCCSELPLHLLC